MITGSIQTIEKQGNPENIWGIKSAKSERDFIKNKIKFFVRTKNQEYEFVMRQMLMVHELFNPKDKEDNYKLELEIISGWKGEGSTEIYRGFDNDFRIIQPIKDKHTGIIKKSPHEVKKEDLNRMIRIIKNLPLNEPTTCYEITKLMGLDWKNDVWKNRTKVYFKSYYFPIKILEKLGVINYSGKGVITRIQ